MRFTDETKYGIGAGAEGGRTTDDAAVVDSQGACIGDDDIEVLTIEDLFDISTEHQPALLTDGDRARMDEAAVAAAKFADGHPVYGRTTGVGANRTVAINAEARRAQDLRLLRSHATGAGPLVSDSDVRMMLLVRISQLRHGGSGLAARVADALVDMLADNSLPAIHSFGSIGTGDLSALAETALTLAGELPTRSGLTERRWQPMGGEALPFISSNALTVARAARAVIVAENWVHHYAFATALSATACRSNLEPFAAEVHRARPQHGQQEVAAMVRHALEGITVPPTRIQDSYGFRAMPQVLAPMVAEVERLRAVVEIEINSAPENPLVVPSCSSVLHNGNFHMQALALAADSTALALNGAAQLSLARLSNLCDPAVTGLTAFLSDGQTGSSGAMVVEYVAAAAMSRLRSLAAPASLGTTVISLGTEDHASFAPSAVDQLLGALDAAESILACELLSARRAIQLTGIVLPPGAPLSSYLGQIPGSRDLADRPLSGDIALIEKFVHSHLPTNMIG